MSGNSFDAVLTALPDVQDGTKLLKLLIDIRKKIDADCPKWQENIAKICEKGSFKHIVASLQTSKKGTINISLSILGNCCLDAKCARDLVTQYGILSGINQVLKRFPKEDSINGRVFRTVGNLCQHSDQWANVIIEKKPQIIIQTVKCLKDSVNEEAVKASEATITMGIRSLRELLNRETLENLVGTFEVLKTVGMLLIKYVEIWENTKTGEGVLNNIIKVLHEYSRYRYYPALTEMRTTSKGDAIAYLSRILLLAPRQIVKIVMNFLKISQLKSDLPIPEMFNGFIEVLRDDSIIHEFNSTCEDCIKCLCHLLDHPGNRENERCGDSIPILIKVLKDLTFDSNRKIECCLLIVSTLNKCKYNKSLILAQIKCGILAILIDKLKLIVGDINSLYVNHKSDKKRKTDILANLKAIKKGRFNSDQDVEEIDMSSVSSSDEENDFLYSNRMRFDHSPASSNESDMAMSWTSGLSPSSSPRSQFFGFSESDSDDYSPVCSEVDPSEYSVPLEDGREDENVGTSELEPDITDDQNSNLPPMLESDPIPIKHIKMKVIMEIVDLMKTYAIIRPPGAQLGTPELLMSLVKGACFLDQNFLSASLDSAEVVCRILECHDYLLPLMQSNFIPAVYDLAKMSHGAWCLKCRQFQQISSSIIKKLSVVAESGGGKGDIAHKLLRGDDATKQRLVLAIPYIIMNKTILVKLMMNCGGLEILMELLKDDSHLQNKSIKALCVLASKKLGIVNPKKVISSCQSQVKLQLGISSSSVTFKLDDGTLLSAERDLLSKNSEFFARLLNGDFKESKEDIITLPNVTNKSLTYLLEFIKCDKTELEDIDLDLGTHLDVITLCDRFLMEEHRVYLTDCVEKFKLSSETIPTIYNWALESRTNLLRVECIAFALVANIIDAKRFEMFKNLFDLGYTEELVDDIKKLLIRYMSVSPSRVCRKRKYLPILLNF